MPAAFAETPGPFRTWLEGRSDPMNLDDRFPPRNFRLDEGVSEPRAERYRATVHVPGDMDDWNGRHERYLETAVGWPWSSPAGRAIDPTAAGCPETFGPSALTARFGATSREVLLVRVMTPYRLAEDARVTFAVVFAALEAWERGDDRQLDSLLLRASRQVGALPAFATYWERLKDILPEDEAAAPPSWASDLRNRLGLSHLRPRGGHCPILVFRYEVAAIPRVLGSPGTRSLTVPTVLDARLFAPFCPPPAGSDAGATVDLAARLERPKPEVLHPPLRLRPRDLFRIGDVTVRPPPIEPARQHHLIWLQVDARRPDYATDTDPDLV